MERRTKFLMGIAVAASLINACADTNTPTSLSPAAAQFAKGVGGGGGGGASATRCATITVTNNPQSVRRSDMPDIKYNLENCGSDPVTVKVTIIETAGFLSELCPAPLPKPVVFTLAARQKVSATAPTLRASCGFTSNVNGTLVQGINQFQGHNLLLTLSDNATGSIFGSAPFIWQDIPFPGI